MCVRRIEDASYGAHSVSCRNKEGCLDQVLNIFKDIRVVDKSDPQGFLLFLKIFYVLKRDSRAELTSEDANY